MSPSPPSPGPTPTPGASPPPGFWAQFLAQPEVPLDLKVRALREAHLLDPDFHAPEGAIAWVLASCARQWADEENARFRQYGFRKELTPDPLAFRRGYDTQTSSERDQAVLPLVCQLLDSGAQASSRAVELALRLELAGTFSALLAHPTAPAPAQLDALANAPADLGWLAWAAGLANPDFVVAMVAHGMAVSPAAAGFARSLGHVLPMFSAGLDEHDPSTVSAVGLAWATGGRAFDPSPMPDLPLGFLGAAIHALRAGRRHPFDGATAALRQAILAAAAFARRFGPDPWQSQAWTQTAGAWRGTWSLPALYARQSLSETGTVGGPVLLLAWLARCPPRWEELSSIAGLPDRGWWALAVWQALGKGPATPALWNNQQRKWALKGLRVRSMADPDLVADALAVTRWLAGTRRTRRASLVAAWASWLLGPALPARRSFDQLADVVQALADPGLGLRFEPSLLSQLAGQAGPQAQRVGVSCLSLLGPDAPPLLREHVRMIAANACPPGVTFAPRSPCDQLVRAVGALEAIAHPAAERARAWFESCRLEGAWALPASAAPRQRI